MESRIRKSVPSVATVLALTVLVCMATPSAATPANPENGDATATVERPVPQQLRQVDIEIRNIVDAEQAALAELFARFEDAPDQATAMRIQLEIRQLRVDTQIALLEAQARHARREGYEAHAVALEEKIHILRNPELVRQQLIQPEPRVETGGER